MIEHLIKHDNIFGFAITGVGVSATILSILNYVTPVVGCIAALIGLYAAYITLKIKLAEWNLWKNDHPESKKYHKFDKQEEHDDFI